MYKLTSPIPGVKVILTENPLNAKVELSETAKRELALLLAIKEMVEDVYSTYFHLHRDKLGGRMVNGVLERDPPDYERAKKYIKYWHDDYFGKDGDSEFTADRWLADERIQMFINELNTEHCGDCTCVASSCTRCYVEDLLDINTLPGSKYVNRSIGTLWYEEFQTPEVKEADQLVWMWKFPLYSSIDSSVS